jgi:hypothetical protein
MLERVIGSQASGAQFVVAVFDDWETLHAVLVEMETDKATGPVTLLHGRREVPANVAASSLLKKNRGSTSLARMVSWRKPYPRG